MFRLLSSHPGASFTSYAAASVAGLAMQRTRRVLGELTRTHMLEQTAPGEYEYHDLLHSYATELTRTVDSADDRRDALHRMLEHYVRTAASAAALLNTVREPMNLPQLQPGTLPQLLDDHDQALDWFRLKRSTLVMAVRLAASNGFASQVCDLSWALADFLDRQGHWGDLEQTQELAWDSAERLGDREVRARASRLLGRAYTQMGEYDVALTYYVRACELCVELADTAGEALANLNLAYLRERRGRLDLALTHAERALLLYQQAGHQVGQARALNSVGWYHALGGDAERALNLCQQALRVSRELNDRHGEADALDSLGYAYRLAGQLDSAIRCYVQAIDLYRQLGSRFAEASALEYLGAAQVARGDLPAARTALREAADILRQLAVADLSRIEAKLDQLSGD
jgi:tetratricopeptide (TPR) repeat protein